MFRSQAGARSLSCVPFLPVHLWHDLYDVRDLFVFLFLQLVSNAIQFLASVAERPAYRSLFEDPTTLANICEKVIVPNIQLRGRLLHYLAVGKGQQAKTRLSVREREREGGREREREREREVASVVCDVLLQNEFDLSVFSDWCTWN